MIDVVNAVELDADTGVLILTGAEESWSAGMDLKEYFREIDAAPEIVQEPIKDVEVTPGGVSIATLSSNTKAPETNIAHLNGSLAAPKEVVLIDAFVQTAPNPSACTVRGIAFSIPR